MKHSPDEYVLHISVSDQSLSRTEAELTIKLDGRQIFRREMETGTQHTWEEMSVTVVGGQHTLEVSEAKTRTHEAQTVDVDRELWVVVTFHSPPDRIQVEIHDRPVGFI